MLTIHVNLSSTWQHSTQSVIWLFLTCSPWWCGVRHLLVSQSPPDPTKQGGEHRPDSLFIHMLLS